MKAFPLYLLLLLALLGCRREDDPKANEPQPLGPVSAEFQSATWSLKSPLIVTDSIYIGAIVFNVLDNTADSVEWQIGSEANRRLGKSVQVSFDQPEGEVPITCFAYRKGYRANPKPENADTLTRSIHVFSRKDFHISGSFLGRSSAGGEEYVVHIERIMWGECDVTIKNLINGCEWRRCIQFTTPNRFSISGVYTPIGGPKCHISNIDSLHREVESIGQYDPSTGSLFIRYWSQDVTDDMGQMYKYMQEHTFYGTQITP